MSVQIPSAAGPPEPPRPVERSRRWLPVAVGAIVVLGVWSLLSGDDAETSPDDTLAVDPPSVSFEQWQRVDFPGAGMFVDVAIDEVDGVALARSGTRFHADAVGSAVWTLDGSTWRMAELDDDHLAAVSSVAVIGEEVLIGGSIGEDTPIPALWSGPPTGPFELLATPFDGPGHVEAVRDLDGVTVLVGRRTDSRRIATWGIPVILAGEPGAWRDITPPGADVVTEIVTFDGRWTAVGGMDGEPMIWESTGQGVTWERRPPALDASGLLADVVWVGSEAYALAVITDVDGFSVQLLSSVTSWRPVGEPRRLAIAWMAEVGGTLIGSPRFGMTDVGVPYLWRHETGGAWSIVRLPAPGDGLTPTVFSAAAGDTIVGGASGRPAMWRPTSGDTVEVPTPTEGELLWDRVATLPSGPFVAFSGETVVVMDPVNPTPTGRRLLVSDDGLEWEHRQLPDGFNIAGIHRVAGESIAVGVRASTVTVGRLDDDGFELLVELEGRPIAVTPSADALVVYLRVADTATRHEIPVDGGQVTSMPVPFVPMFVESIDGIVAAASGDGRWPPTDLHVSLDSGRSWTTIDVSVWAIYHIDGEIVIYDRRGTVYRLVVEPIGLEAIQLPAPFDLSPIDGRPVFGWADGLVAVDADDDLTYLGSIDAQPVSLALSVETGFFGVDPSLAPGGHVVAREGEVWALYRWTGHRP